MISSAAQSWGPTGSRALIQNPARFGLCNLLIASDGGFMYCRRPKAEEKELFSTFMEVRGRTGLLVCVKAAAPHSSLSRVAGDPDKRCAALRTLPTVCGGYPHQSPSHGPDVWNEMVPCALTCQTVTLDEHHVE